MVGAVALSVLGAAFLFAYLPRHHSQQELERGAERAAHALPRVAVITPKLVSSEHKITLPGNVQPLEEAVIYARASGYIRRWYVDIGAHVEKGALLAQIDTPEVDQELAQARAALAQAEAAVVQARANQGLAATKLTRTGKLVEAGVAPQQDLDQTQAQATVNDADVKVAEANVAAQRANIRRLSELQGFSRVEAPFAGTVTSRSVEIGTLVSAGTGTPLFRLAANDPVRVFVQVPQNVAPSVSVNAPADVHIREFPDQNFVGIIARTAGALDSSSRTLNTEVRVPNPTGKLLAGMYAEVNLTLPSPHEVYQIPSTALVTDAAGVRVMVVTPANTLHYQPIIIERDLGAVIQVASGLGPNDRVVQIASADLNEGQKVDIAQSTARDAAPAESSSAGRAH
jgi:RND family efflux transporter MFP subunit